MDAERLAMLRRWAEKDTHEGVVGAGLLLPEAIDHIDALDERITLLEGLLREAGEAGLPIPLLHRVTAALGQKTEGDKSTAGRVARS